MSLFASKIWHWLFKRSSQSASNPNPGTMPYNSGFSSTAPSGSEIIEISTEEEVLLGSTISLGNQVTAIRGPQGELIRSLKKMSVFCGCEHLVSCTQNAQQKRFNFFFSHTFFLQLEQLLVQSIYSSSFVTNQVCKLGVRAGIFSEGGISKKSKSGNSRPKKK